MNSVRTRVRQSLLRPMLVLGGERELVFASGMVAAILALAFGDLVLAAIGITFWLIILVVLQRMAKHDPQLSRVYIRHLNKKVFYPAQAHASALEPELKKHQ
ncbi:MAG: VirB3 family type IV secretion system protein [Candidatus Eremiobacteraeota bacterium]|nr:VirB3 family type IV secretion system protein [Candidatus Eremiobacteraeota bacterium]